jgi:hypothetical protein
MNKTLRKPESEAKYQEYLKNKPDGCPFCVEVSDVNLWRIQPAKFPYDAVYSKHDLLVPTRHVSRREELTLQEEDWLQRLLSIYDSTDEYDSIMYNFRHKQTVPQHLHFHLLKL